MRRPGEQTRIVLALGTAQTLAWGSTYYLPAILAAPMAGELGMPVGAVFGAFSAALVVAALLGPLAGRRIDRFGGRGVLSASSLVFAGGLAALGLAQGPASLVAGWLVLGLGMSIGLYEAAFSTLAGIYGRNARGAITGITLLAGLASTVCWPISALLVAELGWREACLFWAVAHLLVGLPLYRVFLPEAGRPARAELSAPAAGEAPTVLTRGQRAAMPLLALIFGATWFTSTAMAAHLPRLLEDAGASASLALAAAATVGPAQVAGRLLEFGVLQRYHPLLSARLAAMAHPLGAAGLLLFGAPATFLFTLLHGAGNGILTIANGTLPLAIFGPAGYGRRQGLLMLPARFGQAAAPYLFALLIERYGIGALVCSAGLGLTSLGALLVLGRVTRAEAAGG